MPIKLEALIPFDLFMEDPDKVFQLVDNNEQVILLQNNKPVYIITKVRENSVNNPKLEESINKVYTLHEAMEIVLLEAEGRSMHAADLAEEIYRRGLYFKKDGTKAEYTQIRARCNHYHQFEALQGNIIHLK